MWAPPPYKIAPLTESCPLRSTINSHSTNPPSAREPDKGARGPVSGTCPPPIVTPSMDKVTANCQIGTSFLPPEQEFDVRRGAHLQGNACTSACIPAAPSCIASSPAPPLPAVPCLLKVTLSIGGAVSVYAIPIA